MDNPELSAPLVAILGLLCPALISTLKSAAAPAWLNQLVAIAVCLGAGAFSVLVDHGGHLQALTVEQLLAYAGVAFAVAQSVYKLYFGGLGINQKLEQLGIGGTQAAGPAIAAAILGIVAALATRQSAAAAVLVPALPGLSETGQFYSRDYSLPATALPPATNPTSCAEWFALTGGRGPTLNVAGASGTVTLTGADGWRCQDEPAGGIRLFLP